MTDTHRAAADALMKLAERLRMAPLSGGEYRTAHAELESAILSTIERARADERNQCKQVCEAISDRYSKRDGRLYPELRADAETGAGECAAAIEALGTTTVNGLTQAETDASASCAGLSAGTTGEQG